MAWRTVTAMSRRVIISQENIAAAGVRVGDVIRVKLQEGNSLGWFSPHEVVSVDVRVTSPDWYDRIGMLAAGAIALLSRELTVPDAPYSVIAPPEGERSVSIPLLLDYNSGGTLAWRRGVNQLREEDVVDLLRQGWRPVETLNATLTEEVTEDES